MEKDLHALIKRLTLEEKVALTVGRDMWHTQSVDRLGIPSITLTDGPHGVRKAHSGSNSGIGDSYPATCFPTASALAASWDVELVRRVGVALGEECQALDVQILLGPGLNIKRTPLGGRNFEYFSEDPVLSGELAAALIDGVQSMGVGTSAKHFACNNQEFERMTMDVQVDDRTLRELYLAGFERAIRKSSPWTVMAAYNKINGTYASENSYLLRDILREEWGFQGLVMSDWGAVNEKHFALQAGLDLEMPGGADQSRVVALLRSGELSEGVLDEAVLRLLQMVQRATEQRIVDARYDVDSHHALARRAAAESIVLLKNEDGLLPLRVDAKQAVAVIGQFAKVPRYQGAGSSQIVPTHLDIAYEELCRLAEDATLVAYAAGYGEHDQQDETLLQEAVHLAQTSDCAIVFVGLPDQFESEGFDRKHIDLPASHTRLIEEVCRVQSNTIVVLANGSAVAMPWANHVKAIVESWLGGQAVGGAVADVLYGVVNPSGKLAETFPYRLSDTPAYLNYPGESDVVRYGEGQFVGYRYYDKKQIKPQFSFGHGLSYTTFLYEALKVSASQIQDTETLTVSVSVRNTGTCVGKEVVQLYIRELQPRCVRPSKELKAFAKVELLPGEQKHISFSVNGRDFAHYDEVHGLWRNDTGEFAILIGSSCEEIQLQSTVMVESTQMLAETFHLGSVIKRFTQNPVALGVIESLMPPEMVGRLRSETPDFLTAMMLDMPVRKVIAFSQGAVSEEMLTGLIAHINQLVRDSGVR